MPDNETTVPSQLLNDLENPLEEVRLTALSGLKHVSSLAVLGAVRRVARTDPSVAVRFEARQFLAAIEERLSGEDVPRGPDEAIDLDRVRALLAHPESTVRVKIIGCLAMSLDPRVPDLLYALLDREDDPFVVCATLQALVATQGGLAKESLASFLENSDPRVRATAVEALDVIKDPSLLPRLIPLLDDPHHRVRAAVARAIQSQERESVLSCVDRMLADSDETVVRSAVFILRHFDPATALPRLKEKLVDPTPALSRMTLGSLHVLARKGSAGASQILARFKDLARQAADERPFAAVLSPLESPLEDRLESDDAEIRLVAAREVVRLGREDLMPKIRERLAQETDTRVLATLAAAMGRLGVSDDALLFEPFLDSEDPRLRANAVEAIGLLQGPQARDTLEPFLCDPNNRVRANAAVALQAVESLDVVSVLREMVSCGDPLMGRSAVWAAATIASRKTVEVLVTLADSSDKDLALRAREALSELAPVMREAADAMGMREQKKRLRSFGQPLQDAQVQRLLFDLKHESATVRLSTVRTISRSNDPTLVLALRDLLRDEDPQVRRFARESIRKILLGISSPAGDRQLLEMFTRELRLSGEKARSALESILETALRCGVRATADVLAGQLPIEEDPFLRAQILSSLALVGDAGSVSLFRAFVRDPDARVRANALDALHLVGDPEDLAVTVSCLSDPDHRVRATAISVSLGLYKEPFLTHLREMLGSSSVADRRAGLYALLSLTIPERFDLLFESLLAESDPKLTQTCAEAMAREVAAGRMDELTSLVGRISDDAKRRLLTTLVQQIVGDPSHAELGVREGAVPVSSPPDPTGSYARLFERKKQGALSPEDIRTELTREKDPLALKFLLECALESQFPDMSTLVGSFTESTDRRIRMAALEALRFSDGPEAREKVARLLRDRDPDLATCAHEVLRRWDAAVSTEAIRSLLADDQAWVVRRGLLFLEESGGPSELPLVLDVLAKGSSPALVEPVGRLILSWGDAQTLDRLEDLYRRSPTNDRPFLLELGTTLSLKLTQQNDQPVRFSSEPPAAVEPRATRTRTRKGSLARYLEEHGLSFGRSRELLLVSLALLIIGGAVACLYPRNPRPVPTPRFVSAAPPPFHAPPVDGVRR